jgi:3-hydroxy acid dehydrogenase/malonic semialdehyde reductase
MHLLRTARPYLTVLINRQPFETANSIGLCPATITLPFVRNMASAVAKRLEGKTILITGASSGIGRSTAFEFARTSPKNLKLVLTARRLDVLKQVAEDIVKEVGYGVKVLPVQLDVSKESEIKAFVANLPAEFKEIDVLVNNA